MHYSQQWQQRRPDGTSREDSGNDNDVTSGECSNDGSTHPGANKARPESAAFAKLGSAARMVVPPPILCPPNTASPENLPLIGAVLLNPAITEGVVRNAWSRARSFVSG